MTGTSVANSPVMELVLVPLVAFDNVPPVEPFLADPTLGSLLA